MKHYLYSFVLLIVLSTNAQTNGEDKLGSWYMYSGSHIISDKLSITTCAQIRTYEVVSNYQQLFLLAGLNYHFNSKISSTIGYGYLNGDKSFEDIKGDVDFNEQRLYEQVRLKSKVWKLYFDNRLMIEHRFINYGEKIDIQNRMRYRLQVTLPITDTFFMNFYDEIFLNLQDEVFSQNRLYVAFGIKIMPNCKLQLGYLKNKFNSIAYDRLQLGIAIKTDFRKKPKSSNQSI